MLAFPILHHHHQFNHAEWPSSTGGLAARAILCAAALSPSHLWSICSEPPACLCPCVGAASKQSEQASRSPFSPEDALPGSDFTAAVLPPFCSSRRFISPSVRRHHRFLLLVIPSIAATPPNAPSTLSRPQTARSPPPHAASRDTRDPCPHGVSPRALPRDWHMQPATRPFVGVAS